MWCLSCRPEVRIQRRVREKIRRILNLLKTLSKFERFEFECELRHIPSYLVRFRDEPFTHGHQQLRRISYFFTPDINALTQRLFSSIYPLFGVNIGTDRQFVETVAAVHPPRLVVEPVAPVNIWTD